MTVDMYGLQEGRAWHVLAGLFFLVAGCVGGGLARNAETEKIRSVTLDARRVPDASVLPRLYSLGVTHVTLVQFGFQPRFDVPEIRMHVDANWFSESDRGIRMLAEDADSLGMKIILKPHIWLGRYDSEGQSRADIGFDVPEAWQAWEAQYRRFLLHYARLANEIGAGMLVIGTELARSVRERPEFWRGLVREVRAQYDGPLTYAANWWEEYEDIEFWDKLDYIGIQAYFELSHAVDPSKEVLHAGWEPHKKTMSALSKETGRRILFTEIGYRNVPTAAAEPWRWPSRSEVGRVNADDALQERLYAVFFESLWEEPWFAGAILWKWKSDDDRRGSRLDFSIQGRPAERVIAKWFGPVSPWIQSSVK